MMYGTQRSRNRRTSREQVLDVRLRTRQLKAARLRVALAALSIALGTFLGLYLLWRGGEWALDGLVFRNRAFAVQHLDIQTDGVIPIEQIQRWSGVQVGDNLMALDLGRIQRDLELVPLIRAAPVQRVVPDTLRIRVYEREPLAEVRLPVLHSGGGSVDFLSYHLDETGHVMQLGMAAPVRRGPGDAPPTYPLLEGLKDVELRPGAVPSSPRLHSALRLLSAYGRSPMLGMASVQSLELGTGPTLDLLTGQGSRIRFGLQDPEEQLRRWRLVHEFGRQQGRVIRTLDLSVTNNSPVVWMETNTPPAAPEPSTRNRKRNV